MAMNQASTTMTSARTDGTDWRDVANRHRVLLVSIFVLVFPLVFPFTALAVNILLIVSGLALLV